MSAGIKSTATYSALLHDGVEVVTFNDGGLRTGGGVAPIGSSIIWHTATPPTGYLICDGSSIDTTTYADLFAVLGYSYGGSGANFNLPEQSNY